MLQLDYINKKRETIKIVSLFLFKNIFYIAIIGCNSAEEAKSTFEH